MNPHFERADSRADGDWIDDLLLRTRMPPVRDDGFSERVLQRVHCHSEATRRVADVASAQGVMCFNRYSIAGAFAGAAIAALAGGWKADARLGDALVGALTGGPFSELIAMSLASSWLLSCLVCAAVGWILMDDA